MDAAEREAAARGCERALLDTFGFQAPEFYRKRGYEAFGELKDFIGHHSRYYMAKRLEQ